MPELGGEDPEPPQPGRQPNLTRHTLAGLQWTYLQTAVHAAAQLVVAAVLARLLTPTAFGLVALAGLTLRFANYFSRAGITQAVIQRRDLTAAHVRAAFTASWVLGAVFAVVIWAAAPLAANIFDEPDLVPVLRLLGLTMVLYGLSATAESLLRRELRFRALAIVNVGAYLIGYAGVGIALALAGAGVYALVGAVLVSTAMGTVAKYAVARHPVLPTSSAPAYRAILGFGSRVSVISFLEFLGNHLDTLAVGRFAGAAPLGVYNRGYYLVSLPLYQLKTSLSKVLLPAFSSVQHDLPRLRHAYLSAMGAAAAAGIPIAAGIAVAARELVLTVLGPQWVDAIPVVPWLALAAANSLVGHFAGITAEAQAQLRAKFAVTASKVALLAGLLWLVQDASLVAYAAVFAGAATYGQLAYVVVMSRTLQVPGMSIVRLYLPSVATGALVATGIAGVRLPLVALEAPIPAILTVEIITGAIILLLCLRSALLRQVRNDLLNRLGHTGLLVDDPGSRSQRLVRGSVRLVLGGPRSPAQRR